MSRQNLKSIQMKQLNFHKQKLYALIAAGIALVGLLLPWITVTVPGYTNSINGFHGWGVLSFIGVLVVAFLSFMENRSDDYSAENKKYVMVAFGAIALGALLFLLRKNAYSGGSYNSELVRTGIGLWLTILAGIGGLAIVYGLIKIENKTHPKTGT